VEFGVRLQMSLLFGLDAGVVLTLTPAEKSATVE